MGRLESEVCVNARQFLFVGATVVVSFLLWGCGHGLVESAQSRVVRMAELEIDPANPDSYRAQLKEEIATSIRVEPGVLTLLAVAGKDHPTEIRIFEVYADARAYAAHLKTPHFQKYKTGTQGMAKTLKLVKTDPILLGSK